MTHPFEEHLSRIRETLLLMSSLTDKSMALAVQALVERESSLATSVIADDAEIDRLEMEVDERVVTYMATHGPIARDSRLMLAASKISSNLERIADQATTVARRALALNEEPLLAVEPLADVQRMSSVAQQMLHDAITAFVEARFEMALPIISRDRVVDDLNRNVVKGLIRLMRENPENVERAVNIMAVAKAIERAADHAENIAEEVYYLYSGEDIRHPNAIRAAAAQDDEE